MNAIIDEQTAKTLRSPNPAELSAVIGVDRNKWFVITLILSLIILIMMFNDMRLVKKATANTQVIWVKMFSDGRSQVEMSAPDDVQQFYRANIDKNLVDYVSYRWDKRPTTIREDYGRALLFMGRELAGNFTSPQGYYAADKAAKISTAIDGDVTRYHVDYIDHYDKKALYLAGGKQHGELYRTNMYLTQTVEGSHGENKEKPKKFILHVDWRLASKDELKDKNKDFFNVNSLGIVIEEDGMSMSPVTDTTTDQNQTAH